LPRTCIGLLGILILVACAGGDRSPGAGRGEPPAEVPRGGDGRADRAAEDQARAGRSAAGETRRFPPVEAELRNVELESAAGILLRIRRLRGQLVPTRDGQPPRFDDPTSFRLRVADAVVAIDAASLSVLIGQHVFGGDHPVRQVEIAIADGRLVVEGNLRKGIPVPFHLETRPRVAEGGGILLEPDVLRAAGVPMKGLLDFFGLDLVEMMNADRARGIEVRDDRMILHPSGVLPPPRLDARVTAVSVEGDLLVQRLGPPATPQIEDELSSESLESPLPDQPNYQLFRGGVLRFGHLTMEPADLMLVDADPGDPFRFSLARYQRQLVGGYSKTLPDEGLVTIMPDADEAAGADLAPR